MTTGQAWIKELSDYWDPFNGERKWYNHETDIKAAMVATMLIRLTPKRRS